MNMKLKTIALVLATFTAGYAQNAKKPSNDGIFAELETAKGKIVLALEYKKTYRSRNFVYGQRRRRNQWQPIFHNP